MVACRYRYTLEALVYLRPRYLRELDRRQKARNLQEQKRRQRQENANGGHVESERANSGVSSQSSRSWVRMATRIRRSRIAASVQDQLSAVSQVVREGGLDDEEEDFDNETGCSLVDGDDDANAVGQQQEESVKQDED
jgi:hypothetical protein